jgi:hypothetical protein
MKIRRGFVSNSSTTSFCIYGAEVDIPEHIDDYDFECAVEEDDLVMYRPDYSGPYLGMEPWSMGEHETRSQFENRVKELIFKHTGQTPDCDWIEEAYYC